MALGKGWAGLSPLAAKGHGATLTNAAHAVTHVMHEGGAMDEAARLIEGWLPLYDRGGTLHGHIAWHAALCALERGDADRALAIYAEYVRPGVSAGPPVTVVSDSASFLWRLRAYGHAVPSGLWQQAGSYAAPHFPKAGFAFADAHMAILEAAVGDRTALERRTAALTALAAHDELPAGRVVPEICRAALAFAEEDYAACARILAPVATEVVRIGSSGAQREILQDMLLLALMRGGGSAKARALLDRRLHRRPSRRDTRLMSELAA